MQRREFMTLIGAAGVAWPLQAQGLGASAQPLTAPVIGFIHSASPSYFAQFAGAVRDGLKEAGYVEGRNVTIEYRWAEGHYERLPALVADLVERQVAEIFAAGGTDPAKAAKAATSVIPIVFISAADPVGAGLVVNLNKPGGNFTGVSLLASALDAKKLGLLRDLVPTAATIGAVINPDYPGATVQSDEFLEAAGRLGVRPLVFHARTDSEIEAAFARLHEEGASALLVSSDPFFNSRREFPPAGVSARAAGDLSAARIRHGRRPDELWAAFRGRLSPGRSLCGSSLGRCESGRTADPAAGQVRACHQSQDCEGAWRGYAADAARDRGRGDRMTQGAPRRIVSVTAREVCA